VSHQFAANRKTQSAADAALRTFGLLESLEQSGSRCFGNAGTAVLDVETQRVRLARKRNGNFAALTELDRIVHEVQHNLLDTDGIAAHET
jgi:uncharacterized membrane protein YjjP (DUF1212 family)